ncbi:MAG: hypothetical protein J6U90_03720 [Methanobrevibacter sp.]|nr:hypothetical protein [Methanobrevibacter sp.]
MEDKFGKREQEFINLTNGIVNDIKSFLENAENKKILFYYASVSCKYTNVFIDYYGTIIVEDINKNQTNVEFLNIEEQLKVLKEVQRHRYR